MTNTAADPGFPSSDMDNVMFLGGNNSVGGVEDSISGADIFFGSSPMVTDLDDAEIFQTSPDDSNYNPGPTKDEGHPRFDNRQSGSSPEESSEDSSSDDSARHKRKSSSMSFQISNDGDVLDRFKMWTDGPPLAPALSTHGTTSKLVRDLGNEMSNEDMEIHFDFKSAASSPRPATLHSQQATNTTVSLVQRQAETQARRPPKPMGASPLTNLPSPDMTVGTHAPTYLMDRGDSPENRPTTTTTQRVGVQERRFGNATTAYDSNFNASPIHGVLGPGPLDRNRSRLIIHPIPQKSRVETQIPIKITLFPVPDGIKKLHLPTHTISKPKLIQRPKLEKSPDTLELYSMLVCTSAMQDPQKRAKAFATAAAKSREKEENEYMKQPKSGIHDTEDPESPLNGGEVNICSGCITRERKRAARKKSKKPDEEAAWANDEARRVVVFNTNELRPWDEPEEDCDPTDPEVRGRTRSSLPDGAKQVKMPMRIACYCRHHSEKIGFQVILTVKDYKDGLVAQAMSQPIVITDDHKAQPPTAVSPASGMAFDSFTSWVNSEYSPIGLSSTHIGGSLQRNAFSSNDLQSFHQQAPQQQHSQLGFRPFASVQSAVFNAPTNNRPNKSRQTSPSSSGPMNKKRKSSTGPKIPESLVMTKTQLSPGPMSAAPASTAGNSLHHIPNNATTSPFKSQFPPQTLKQATQSRQRTPPYHSGPPTPDSSTNDFFSQLHRSHSFEANSAAQPMFSQPPSSIPSRAPSPSSLAQSQAVQNTVQRVNAVSSFTVNPAQAQQRSAVINKVIPTQGPIAGGIEVTCLGSGFYQGVEVMFGDALATTTTYWGDSTLVCLLPPADRPGQVPVTLKHQYEQILSGARHTVNASFTYVDGSEQDMLRQALVILGQKITGRVEDAGDIVRHVLPSTQGNTGWTAYGSNGVQHRQNFVQNLCITSEASTEDVVIKCLELMDTDRGPYKGQLDLSCNNGQTLLHLAASLGYQRLVTGLLARGASVDECDRNGFSPMHMASLRGHSHIVTRLRLAGGNPLLRSRLGFSPADLATDLHVIRALRLHPSDGYRSYINQPPPPNQILYDNYRHLTPPESRAHSSTRYDAGDEWNDASSDEDEDSATVTSSSTHQSSRRNSIVARDINSKSLSPTRLGENFSPPAALLVWRNQLAAQIQQFQQSVESLLPPLQMPALPALSPMLNLPNYQTPAMVRRISNLVPQRGSRPESPDNVDASPREGEHKWWDIFSSSHSPPNSPPAYSEIYPEPPGDLDTKASAIASVSRDGKDHLNFTGNRTSSDPAFRQQDNLLGCRVDGKQTIQVDATTGQRKRLRSDRNLFFIWIPLLLVLITVALRDRIPNAWNGSAAFFERFRKDHHERPVKVN